MYTNNVIHARGAIDMYQRQFKKVYGDAGLKKSYLGISIFLFAYVIAFVITFVCYSNTNFSLSYMIKYL